MPEFNIHNVRFFDFEPKSIQIMCYEEKTKRLALSRADGSIEIWNCQRRPFMQLVIPGDDEGSVEALVWCDGRLFCAGLNGFLLEYDLVQCRVKSRTAVTGGPTWCLSRTADGTKLAAGTEEGYVCIFSVLEDTVQYEKMLEKQEGRILSIAWHSSGDYIVTGSVNCIRFWSLKEGRVTRCSVGQSSQGREVIVWCVGILDDLTIVSGDSRGKTCFWNAKLGTIIDAVTTHNADILCLSIVPHENSVYVAGIDPAIVEVKQVRTGSKKGQGMRWIKSIVRNIHTHDVRALALTEEQKLFSGGVDTVLALSYFPPKTVHKFPARPYPGSLSVGSRAEHVLFCYKNRVELWGLGRPSAGQHSSRFLPLAQDRIKLLELQCSEEERIDWGALSPDANCIAYILKGNIRIFKFYPPKDGSQISVRRVRGMSRDIQPSRQIMWLSETRLVSVSTQGTIQIINVSDIEATLEGDMNYEPEANICLMKCSTEGDILLVANDRNFVFAFDLTTGNKIPLPVYNSPVTAFGISPVTREVLVVYADMMIKEFNLDTCRYTKFCKNFMGSPPVELSKRNSVIHTVSYDLEQPNLVFLHDDSSIIVLDKEREFDNEKQLRTNKVKRYDPAVSDFGDSNSSLCNTTKVGSVGSLSFVRRANQILYFSHMKNNSLLSIEFNPLHLMDKLPPTLMKKKYGGV